MAINKTDNVGSVEEESTVKAEPTKKISKITDNKGKTEVVQEEKRLYRKTRDDGDRESNSEKGDKGKKSTEDYKRKYYSYN